MASCEHFWNFNDVYNVFVYEKINDEGKPPNRDMFDKYDILDKEVTYPDEENGYCITLREEIELRVNKIFKKEEKIILNNKNYNNNLLNSINYITEI